MAFRFVAFCALVAVASAANVDYTLTGNSLTGSVVPAFRNAVSYSAPSTAYVSAVPAYQNTYAYAAPASAAVISAPAIHKTISYSAPAAFVAAAPVVHKTISYSAAAPVVAQVAVKQEVARNAVHQVHIANRQRNVRIEEYKRPEQLIRIHESAQREPESVSFSAPAEPASTIRVVNHAAPAARVERVVSQQPGQQVFDIEKPAAPADRVITITRGAKPTSKVEFYSDSNDEAAEVVLEENPNRPQVQYTGSVAASTASLLAAPATYAAAAPAPVRKTVSYAAPASYATYAAPASYATYAAPASYATYAAPASYATYAAPATVQKTFSYAAPATVQKTISYAAPALHKTIAYSAPSTTLVAPAIHKTVSYAAPALHKTISYAAPSATLVAPAVHKTISYSAPVVQKSISFAAAPVSATYATSYDTDFHAKSS